MSFLNHTVSKDARWVAMQVLTQVMAHRRSLSDCLETHLSQLNDKRDKALTQALCYGVLRWLPRLQAVLKQLLTNPLKPKEKDIEVLLLMGLYQLIYLRVPDHAAINETVEITRLLNKSWATGLVNAVLRHFQRQGELLLVQVDRELEANLAHPTWMLDRLKTDWPEHWRVIAQANNSSPPMILRVNARQNSREDYLDKLQQVGIKATPTSYSDMGIVLEQAVDVEELPGFSKGWVSVQDEAAQLAALLLDIPKDARVLDACAAPGGKTAHLLERYEVGTLLALDNQPDRVIKLEETLKRLHLSAYVKCADATQPATWWDGHPFDCILLDVPCSGSGVIRRHPDIKYLRQPQDSAGFILRQQHLLEALWPLLHHGGKLLYATCSVFAEENQLQIEKFLSTHPDGYELRFSPFGTVNREHSQVEWGWTLPVGRQVLPSDNPSLDGFYYACLVKTIETHASPTVS